MNKFQRKPKHPKAVWTRAFKGQAKRLRPENGPSGGIRAQSGSQAARNAVYGGIRELYLSTHSFCQIHASGCTHDATEIHHRLRRNGLLLFDVRHFFAACSHCHMVVHSDEQEAIKRGWLTEKGKWGVQE